MPVKILNELIKHNYQGFPSERLALEHLISSQLKDPNYNVDKCMNLVYKLMELPDIVNESFGLTILKGLRNKGEWDHFKKVCMIQKTHLELWEAMIDWGIEKKAGAPSLENVLECLINFKHESPISEHSCHLFNKLAFELMKYKRLDVDLKNLDKIFEKMKDLNLGINT